MTGENFAFADALRLLLPPAVRVEAGRITKNVNVATDREQASVGATSMDRKREFENGRTYAKRALAAFGLHSAELPVGSNRAPIWPEGFTGSITHARRGMDGICAAAVARSNEFSAIGIDVEFASGIDPAIWPTILSAWELDQLKGLSAQERGDEAIRRWCAKEAIIKAFQLRLDPLTIEIRRTRNDGSQFVAVFETQTLRWCAQTTISEGLVLAAVAVPFI